MLTLTHPFYQVTQPDCHQSESHPGTLLGRMTMIICASLLLTFISGCGAVPQVVDDEAVFGELDALYTAVTSKRSNLLNDCRARLTKLHDEAKLSDAGFTEVTTIMQMCDDEDWAPAAERLYGFMRAQRKSQ